MIERNEVRDLARVCTKKEFVSWLSTFIVNN
jgi:hypothetical protein